MTTRDPRAVADIAESWGVTPEDVLSLRPTLLERRIGVHYAFTDLGHALLEAFAPALRRLRRPFRR